MDRQIKLFIALFLAQISIAAVAANCQPTDDRCILGEKQLKAINQSGLKPTKVLETDTTKIIEGRAAKGVNDNAAKQPFPTSQTRPYVYGATDSGTLNSGKSSQGGNQGSNSEQNRPNPILELFAPKQQTEANQNSNTNSGAQNQQNSVAQSGTVIYR